MMDKDKYQEKLSKNKLINYFISNAVTASFVFSEKVLTDTRYKFQVGIGKN